MSPVTKIIFAARHFSTEKFYWCGKQTKQKYVEENCIPQTLVLKLKKLYINILTDEHCIRQAKLKLLKYFFSNKQTFSKNSFVIKKQKYFDEHCIPSSKRHLWKNSHVTLNKQNAGIDENCRPLGSHRHFSKNYWVNTQAFPTELDCRL